MNGNGRASSILVAAEHPFASPTLLGLTNVDATSIPARSHAFAYREFTQTLLASSTALISSLTTAPELWKPGKTFNKSAPTASFGAKAPPGGGDTQGFRWHARRSRHQVGWDNFRDGLLVEHSLHEKDYIHSCVEARRVEVIEEGVMEIWQMSYALPIGTSNRDFVVLIITMDTTSPAVPESPAPARSFQVISIPVTHPDAPLRKGWVRARYVSVEEVKEDGDGVIWSMATASNASGVIPKWISELAMPGKISEDVPSFLSWLETRKTVNKA